MKKQEQILQFEIQNFYFTAFTYLTFKTSFIFPLVVSQYKDILLSHSCHLYFSLTFFIKNLQRMATSQDDIICLGEERRQKPIERTSSTSTFSSMTKSISTRKQAQSKLDSFFKKVWFLVEVSFSLVFRCGFGRKN